MSVCVPCVRFCVFGIRLCSSFSLPPPPFKDVYFDTCRGRLLIFLFRVIFHFPCELASGLAFSFPRASD